MTGRSGNGVRWLVAVLLLLLATVAVSIAGLYETVGPRFPSAESWRSELARPTHERIGKFWSFLKMESRDSRIVALWGGAGSGKSIAICQEMVDRLLLEKDIKILILRKTGPSLTHTTYQMILELLEQYGKVEGRDFVHKKAEGRIIVGQNQMIFAALDDPAKKKSLNINYAYLEEATEFTWDDFVQIRLRLRRANRNGQNQILLSFNPTDEFHWTKPEILDRADGVTIATLHSTYKDNWHLPEDYTENLKSLAEIDPAAYATYAKGEYAVIENVIYRNFVIDNPQQVTPICFGLDFGYTNPSVLVAVGGSGLDLSAREMIYRSGMTNADLIALLKQVIPSNQRHVPIYADPSSPDFIAEIRMAGFNCVGADNAVKEGIDKVKRFRLHLSEYDVNLLKEVRSYKWREDRLTGRIYDEPVKLNDHAMDALRYAIKSCPEIIDPAAFVKRANQPVVSRSTRSTVPGMRVGSGMSSMSRPPRMDV